MEKYIILAEYYGYDKLVSYIVQTNEGEIKEIKIKNNKKVVTVDA